MKKLFFFFLILLNMMGKAWAEDECSAYKVMPELHFTSSYGKLVYDKSKSYDELTKLGKEYGIVEQGLFASGLALVEVVYQVSVDSYRRKIGLGKYCVIPARVNLFVGYSNPVILIAKELKEDTCEYNVVLRHEQTHQQINVSTLRYFLPKLKTAAVSIINNVDPILITRKNDSEEATQMLTDIYARQLEPLINFLKKEVLKEQSKLDNQTNYQHEGELCRYYNATH